MDLKSLIARPDLLDINFAGSVHVYGDLANMATLQKIRSVDLSSCTRVAGNIELLSSLTSLTSLTLQGCGGVEGKLHIFHFLIIIFFGSLPLYICILLVLQS